MADILLLIQDHKSGQTYSIMIAAKTIDNVIVTRLGHQSF